MKNWYFHQKLVFYLFFCFFGLLLGLMHRNMQNNCYINGKLYLKAKSLPFLKFAFFCMSGIVLCIFHRVILYTVQYTEAHGKVHIDLHIILFMEIFIWLMYMT